MGWNLLGRRPAVEDLTPLLVSGWTGGTVTAARASGGAVTIYANSLTRAEAGTGTVALLTLPARLAPVEHLYGPVTFRGMRIRCLNNGVLSIDNPAAILDYFSLTYVPKGGA